MDDLSGLEWSSKPGGSQAKPPPIYVNPSYGSYPALQATPSPFGSGRSTPLQAQASSSSGQGTAPVKPGQDSFSNLVKFGPAKTSQNLSLAERQAQLQEEKKRKEEEKRKQQEAAFGNGQFWDTLGNRGASTSSALKPPAPSNGHTNGDDELFAAFNKDTEVDNASFYPPPESRKSTPVNALDLKDPTAWGSTPTSNAGALMIDDDDPFGLKDIKSSASTPNAPIEKADDDDFLGDLGRPVEEVRRQQQASQLRPEPGKPIEEEESSSEDEVPPARQPVERRPTPKNAGFDKAVAQLIDYGFTPEDARRGLIESGAGTNVQQAANWLLDDAHRKAKEKAKGGRSSSAPSSQPERRSTKSSANGGDDLTKTAAAVGNTLFKTANSLWKTGQKKAKQAIAEFQQEGGDPNQPKWMREAHQAQTGETRRTEVDHTDEALMLESGGRPKPRTNSRPAQESRSASQPQRDQQVPQPTSRGKSPAPRWQQQSAPPADFDSKARLSRLGGDDDVFSHRSSNRRRPAPPAEAKKPEPEEDLLFGGGTSRPSQSLPESPAQRPPQQQPVQSAPQQQPARRPQPKPSSPTPPRPTRQMPPISPDALQKSTKLRHAGTAHFKLGDYSSAHASYSLSLSAVPPTHPLAIVLLTNHALTALKTGEPKQAVDDADQAIKLIGPGRGEGETVAVKGENGQDENRDMKELYGKALSRKAEALEQMEKWSDAAAVWQLCVEVGAVGTNAIKGRQRCQAALAPKPKPPLKIAAKLRPAAPTTQKSSEAVTRLREANEAAAKEDDEKFALSEKVDAKVSAWRDGKRDNLRALLGSMDNVLWEGSGWKKVGLHELVMANKVKITYMKAIAKTHPDKVSPYMHTRGKISMADNSQIPQNASTEVRLIAGLVFSTLNESWDKFKAENGL